MFGLVIEGLGKKGIILDNLIIPFHFGFRIKTVNRKDFEEGINLL